MISALTRANLAAARIALAALACAALPWISSADESVTSRIFFTEGEIKIILSHGPWPAPAPRDPTNRVSGQPHAIELGMRLFFDQRLSGNGTMACATCHVPERN